MNVAETLYSSFSTPECPAIHHQNHSTARNQREANSTLRRAITLFKSLQNRGKVLLQSRVICGEKFLTNYGRCHISVLLVFDYEILSELINMLKAITNATLSLDFIVMHPIVMSTQNSIYTINFNHFQNILEKENGNSIIESKVKINSLNTRSFFEVKICHFRKFKCAILC